MVYEVILDPLASDEWIAILSRYNAIREGLDTEAYDEVKVYLFALAEDAFLYQKRYGEVRVSFTKRFHFAIYYIIRETDVYVIAVKHQREDPDAVLWRAKNK